MPNSYKLLVVNYNLFGTVIIVCHSMPTHLINPDSYRVKFIHRAKHIRSYHDFFYSQDFESKISKLIIWYSTILYTLI